jgi:hypothetical protein
MPTNKTPQPIRVTLVSPAAKMPAWIQRIQVRLEDAHYVDLTTVALPPRPGAEPGRPLFFDFWMRLETTVFGHKIVGNEHSEKLVSGRNQPGSLPADVDTDVIVWMLPNRPPPEIFGAAKHGVITIAGAFERMFGLNEFLEQNPATRCDIAALGSEPAEDRVLVSSYANTDAILFSRGQNGIRAKCRALLLATVKRLWREVDPRLDGLPEKPVSPVPRTAPGNLKIAWRMMQIVARLAAASLFSFGRFNQWQVAYRLGGDRLDQSGLKFIAPSHTGFWADPFIAEREGRRFIFFEELSPDTNQGHLAAIEVFDDGKTGEPVNVLVRDEHLSYPFLFEFAGSLFMVPECSASGRIEAFRCEQFPDRWEPHAVLIDDVVAFDPTLIEHDGLWWMFATIQHDGNTWNDELNLFYATNPFAEWIPHALNPVKLDVRAARPAGAIFSENGKLYRPGQDCSGRYGRAISIQEIRRMTPHEYEEVEVRRIPANFAPGALGTHTINQAHGIVVYDCEVRARK